MTLHDPIALAAFEREQRELSFAGALARASASIAPGWHEGTAVRGEARRRTPPRRSGKS